MEQALHAKTFYCCYRVLLPIAYSLFFFQNHAVGQNVAPASNEIFVIYRNTGYDFEDLNQLDSAKFYYENALNIAQKTNDQYNLATIYTDLAIISRKQADYVACKNYHQIALNIAEANGDQDMVEDNLHGIGYLYENLGDYENAVTYYLRTLALSQQNGKKEGSIVTLQNIAKTYMQLNFKDLAFKNIEQAKLLAEQLNNDSTLANVLQDFGEIHVHFGEHEQALDKLQAALKTYESVGYQRYIASCLVYIGDVYARLGRIELTQAFFNRALKYHEVMDPYVLADLYIKLGDFAKNKKQTREALQFFEKSYAIAQVHKFKDIQLKNTDRFYQIANESGNQSEALKWLQLTSSLKNEIYNLEKNKSIAEMHFKYKTAEHESALQALQLKQTRWTLFVAVAIFLIVLGFLAFIAKMSARNNRLLENKNREIQLQNIQLSESNNVLRQYAYVAAHDLKEPLRTICSFINLLEIKVGKKLDDPEAIEYMQFISNAAKRMNVLLTDLLEYSSIFHQKPGTDIIDAKAVLEEVCVNLRTLRESKQAHILYPDELPHLLINRIHLVQIFQNLIGNALKFTNGHTPVVQVQYKIEGNEIVFSLKDNGIGISEVARDKIFNLFFRAGNAQNVEGTGIGLSICKSLTEKYGGRIWFQSVENQGTTFFFSFPKEMLVQPASRANHSHELKKTA